MENDLKKKWKTNQSTKINLIGCDTIVNSPSLASKEKVCLHRELHPRNPNLTWDNDKGRSMNIKGKTNYSGKISHIFSGRLSEKNLLFLGILFGVGF